MKILRTIKRIKDNLLLFWERIIVRCRYSVTLKRLRKKFGKEKLRVVFLTNEPQKWSYDSVYWELKNSSYFDPLVLVVPRYRVHMGWDKTRMSLEEQFNFFKERGYSVEYGYKDGKYINLNYFEPDILFYLQLAEVPGYDNPVRVSRHALTAYCPYAFQLSDYKKHYLQSFHKLLFVNYMEHELTIERFESYKKGNSKNCVSVGYPKLDVYLNPVCSDSRQYWKDSSKIKIIYAPHHSFRKTEANIFRWGTFNRNYKLILNLAKSHPETTWIFKPHPMLKKVVVDEGIMNEKEVNEYYAEWEKIGNVYDSGDYFDIFKTSDLMITDCGSFLAEYLPSHKPLIRLVNQDGISLNKLGEQFSNCYYNAKSDEEFLYFFKELVVNNNDYLYTLRNEKAESLVDKNVTAAHKIFVDLYNRLK